MSILRVMTFNIRGSYRDQDTANAWSQRATLNVETIQRHNPDLIGFQELQAGNLAMYQQQLPEYQYVLGPEVSSQQPPYEYPAIFWKPVRLSPLRSGRFWLSETPEVASTSWDSACIRGVNWIHFREMDSKREFLHLNTHLDHVSEQARLAGSQQLLHHLPQLREGDLPVVLTGDFNCDPGTPSYQLFHQHGFADTYLTTGNTDSSISNTFHGFGKVTSSSLETQPEGTQRIDWLLLQDATAQMQVSSCEILRDARHPLYPSDHYPVLTEFSIK